jgi:hypothetical protein
MGKDASRRTLRTAVVTALAVASAPALLAPPAPAAPRPTYCQSVAIARKAKRFGVNHRVVLLRRAGELILCSDVRRKAVTLPSGGGTPARFLAVENKCALVLTTRPRSLPALVSVDLRTAFRRPTSSAGITPIGYGNPSATVVSLALASNCVAASGAVVDQGGGVLDRRIDTVQIHKNGGHLVFASGIPTTDDLKRLALRPLGANGAMVSWTENGAPVSRELPG